MALPSQMDQGGSAGRGHVYARDRKNGKPLMVALGILVVAGAAAGIWAFKKSPTGTPAESSAGTSKLAAGTGGEKAGSSKSQERSGSDRSGSAKPGGKTDAAGSKTGTTPPVSLAPTPREPVTTPMTTPVTTPVSTPPLTLQQGTGGAGVPGAAEAPGPLSRSMSGMPGTGSEPRTQPDHPKPAPVDLSRPDGRPVVSEPGVPGPAGPETAIAASGSTMEVRQTIEAGDRKMSGGELAPARVLYSKALMNPNASKDDQERLRGKLAQINQDLLFSSKVVAGDPLVESYTVVAGDSLVKIAKKRDLAVDWRLIQRVNAMASPNTLRVGQKLKLVRGPFHAVVHKSDYRVDIFSGPPDEPSNWIYIRSFRCGLGANDKTPVGDFVVKPASKLVNPPWTNPQTGERFGADDPKNPIGEHWIGIEGVGDSKKYTGFGLHGTIEPDSIGQQKSMGCVRMQSDDIALVYELLKESVSVVKIEA